MTTAAQPIPDTVVAPNWFLGILPAKYMGKRMIPFGYEVDMTPLAVSAATQGPFTTPIQQDSDFLCLSLQTLITDVNNPPGLLWGSGFTANNPSRVLVQIADQATQQLLQQTLVPLDNLAGSGPFPAPLPYPFIFTHAGAIQVQAVNQNNATMNVRMTFSGIRIFI